MELSEIMRESLPSDSEFDDVFTMVARQIREFEEAMSEYKGRTFDLGGDIVEATINGDRETILAVKVDKGGQVFAVAEYGREYALGEIWCWEAFEVMWKLRQSVVNGIDVDCKD